MHASSIIGSCIPSFISNVNHGRLQYHLHLNNRECEIKLVEEPKSSTILSLSLTYKSLQFKQPSSILDLLKIQPTHSTRSSAVVIHQRPSNPSRLKITDRSFYHQAPALWNSLPKHLHALSSISPTQTNYSLLSLFPPPTQFHKNLPFPSILSSLDHLLSGLTLWNWTRPDLHVIHIHSIYHSSAHHSLLGIFILYMMSTVYRNKLAEIHFCQLYGAL